MDSESLKAEFEKLEERTFDAMKSELLSTENHPAWVPEHQQLNRYANITPSIHTLVDPYMNANTISIRDFSTIAAQCPLLIELPTLYNLFFTHIDCIVMLCNVEEGKVDEYYPEKNVELASGGLVIACTEVNAIRDDLIFRKLEIANGEQTRTINHYELTSWPDLSRPHNIESLELLIRLTPSRRSFVHCSAGVGRTGSFILCRSLLGARDVDFQAVNDLILQIRRQRSCFMVQSFEQYQFCYEYLVRDAHLSVQ